MHYGEGLSSRSYESRRRTALKTSQAHAIYCILIPLCIVLRVFLSVKGTGARAQEQDSVLGTE